MESSCTYTTDQGCNSIISRYERAQKQTCAGNSFVSRTRMPIALIFNGLSDHFFMMMVACMVPEREERMEELMVFWWVVRLARSFVFYEAFLSLLSFHTRQINLHGPFVGLKRARMKEGMVEKRPRKAEEKTDKRQERNRKSASWMKIEKYFCICKKIL